MCECYSLSLDYPHPYPCCCLQTNGSVAKARFRSNSRELEWAGDLARVLHLSRQGQDTHMLFASEYPYCWRDPSIRSGLPSVFRQDMPDVDRKDQREYQSKIVRI